MTVIRPNSISGVTSITALANEINVFRHNGVLAGLQLNGVNHHTSAGVSTFHTVNVLGNLDVAGVLTYQDVTNVDSLGIGTFRTGINVSGGQLDVGSNIKLGNAGVITATAFVGDGSGLTGAGPSLTNGANDRIITATGANALNGEANLTFDGTQLKIGGDSSVSGTFGLEIYNTDSNEGTALIAGTAGARLDIMDTGSSERLRIAAAGAAYFISYKSGDPFIFQTTNGSGTAERVRITSDGELLVGTANKINTSTSKFQVASNDATGSAIFARFNASVYSSYLDFYKSRNNTIGSATVVNSDDHLGSIRYYGADGSNSGYTTAAEIYGSCDGGSSASGDMPGRITFHTRPDGAGQSMQERLRIDSNGEVLIGATARGREKGFHLAGANQDPTGVWTQMGIYSTDSQAANKGGSLGFGGHDGSVAKQQFAAIKGAKENGTSGNYAGYMAFYTRPAGSVSGERMRINSDGKVGMGAQTNPQGQLDIRTTNDDDAIRLVNTSTGNNGIQWWNEYGGLTKRVSMDYGEGDANFDIRCFRADSQDNRPYGNVRIMTGSYSNPTTNFRVTTLGSVHMPNQPSFSAADTAGHVYGSSSTPTMVFNNADFNVGNNYNTSNGIFTAPIAGKYQFSFCGMAAGGSGDFQVRITKNGGGYFNNNGSGRGYSTFEPYGFTVLMDLAINDTVQIKIYSSNTSCYIYAGQTWNRFSGYLIG